jgi:uncharacterized protein (DUF305 family)
MNDADLNESISHNFIVQMLPHHRAAVSLSQNLLQYTTNIPLQNLALEMITEQTAGMEALRSVMDECTRFKNPPQQIQRYEQRMDQIMQKMFLEMSKSPIANQINKDYIYEMIPHQKGAVEMAENTLSFDIPPTLVPMLESIILTQSKVIHQLEELLPKMQC